MEMKEYINERKELYTELCEYIEGDFLKYGIDLKIKLIKI